jgi:hypothetical protein
VATRSKTTTRRGVTIMPETVSTEPKAHRKVSCDSVIYEVAYGIGY